ncbi:MAG: hypothetical protein AAFY28_15190 [Actinomycetota bacterium]
MHVVRVLPDLTGLDKTFLYTVPDDVEGRVDTGTMVRVELHGRRIGGWVLERLESDTVSDSIALKPLKKVTGHGPTPALIELAEWATIRWAAGRVRPFLVAASPARAVPRLPTRQRSGNAPGPSSPATADLLRRGGGTLRLPPRVDVLPSILSAIALGPTLVIAPTGAEATLLGLRLRRAGVTVADVPADWARAAGGVDVVIGARTAAWAPCADLAAIVVVDEHDERLQTERSPTWHARDVAVERGRRAGVPVVMLSPAPTLTAMASSGGPDAVVHPPARRERAGWPRVIPVDRRGEPPWQRSLLTSPLIERLRDHSATVVCVSNITGRARVLACRNCQSLVRCERCTAAVGLDDDGMLRCRRCGTTRPPVCQVCGGTGFANLRPGVTRLREELEAAAGRPVVSVTGADDEEVVDAGVYVGTEAVLHRLGRRADVRADVVVFLEFDSELLAPRYRAAEQAMALLILAGRLAPTVMIQTFIPDHEVVQAAVRGNPAMLVAAEEERRRMFRFPPYAAIGLLSGSGSAELAAGLPPTIDVAPVDESTTLVRGTDWMELGRALNAAPRPSGARPRIVIDPPRL